jgi:hypothetical protein
MALDVGGMIGLGRARKAFARPSDPLEGDPRLFLEDLGYDIDTDSDQPGLWIWTAPSDGCDSSYPSAQEALDGAWNDASEQARQCGNISSHAWEKMSFDRQRMAITLALSGELPPLADLRPDTSMEWVSAVHALRHDLGPKETYQLAEKHYLAHDFFLSEHARVAGQAHHQARQAER